MGKQVVDHKMQLLQLTSWSHFPVDFGLFDLRTLKALKDPLVRVMTAKL